MSEPDKYSNAWYRRQFMGLHQALNSCLADYSACSKEVKESREQLAEFAAKLNGACAELGRQKDEIESLKESIDKARTVFAELRRNQETRDNPKGKT